MKTLHFSIDIKAPKERVWRMMLDPGPYKSWTGVFAKGSYYEWSWEKGSKIKFLAPDRGGIIGVIAENIPYEFISVRLLGEIKDGVEDTTGTTWAPAYENYTLTERGGITEVRVDVDVIPEHEKYMEETWPEALKVLKNISE